MKFDKKDLIKQKNYLKNLRAKVEINNKIAKYFTYNIIEAINSQIGLINCHLTDDDEELERLAIEDKIRM